MNDKINLTNTNGTTISTDLICFIESNASGKRYIYHTLNEEMGTDSNKTVKIYIDKIRQNNPSLDTPITDEEWGILRGYMGDAIKGVENVEIKYLPISELSDPFIVSERAIAMPVSYDYVTKQRGIYAESIVKNEISNETNVQPTESVQTQETIADASVNSAVVTNAIQNDTVNVASTQPVTPEVAPTNVDATVNDVQQGNMFDNASAEPIAEPAPAPTQDPVVTNEIQQSNMIEPNSAPAGVESQNNMFDSQTNVVQPATIEPAPAVNIQGVQETINTSNEKLEPIDISSIEAKYNEMINGLKDLMAKEIEAANRYNATIELSSMHNEQHASYVQNEQIKEANMMNQNTTNVQASEQPVVQETVQQPEVPTVQTVEPTPITPITPQPIENNNSNVETNWFDLPPAN